VNRKRIGQESCDGQSEASISSGFRDHSFWESAGESLSKSARIAYSDCH